MKNTILALSSAAILALATGCGDFAQTKETESKTQFYYGGGYGTTHVRHGGGYYNQQYYHRPYYRRPVYRTPVVVAWNNPYNPWNPYYQRPWDPCAWW